MSQKRLLVLRSSFIIEDGSTVVLSLSCFYAKIPFISLLSVDSSYYFLCYMDMDGGGLG